MLLPILHYNDPLLRKKGATIVAFDDELAKLAKDMIDTMHKAEGLGLAAQQVGRVLQLCVVDMLVSEADYDWKLDGAKLPLDLFMPLVLVNPRVTPLPGSRTTMQDEGCLSFPHIRGDVERPDVIEAVYQDLNGLSHTLLCTGLFSRCIQHEVDHLNGTFFIDRMEKKSRQKIEPDIRALARQTRAAAKVEA